VEKDLTTDCTKGTKEFRQRCHSEFVDYTRADFGVSPKPNSGSRGGTPRDAPETGALPLPFHNSSADCSFNFSND
jgi:hypothetical protein